MLARLIAIFPFILFAGRAEEGLPNWKCPQVQRMDYLNLDELQGQWILYEMINPEELDRSYPLCLSCDINPHTEHGNTTITAYCGPIVETSFILPNTNNSVWEMNGKSEDTVAFMYFSDSRKYVAYARCVGTWIKVGIIHRPLPEISQQELSELKSYIATRGFNSSLPAVNLHEDSCNVV